MFRVVLLQFKVQTVYILAVRRVTSLNNALQHVGRKRFDYRCFIGAVYVRLSSTELAV